MIIYSVEDVCSDKVAVFGGHVQSLVFIFAVIISSNVLVFPLSFLAVVITSVAELSLSVSSVTVLSL